MDISRKDIEEKMHGMWCVRLEREEKMYVKFRVIELFLHIWSISNKVLKSPPFTDFSNL
jgi:hypothetical protein